MSLKCGRGGGWAIPLGAVFKIGSVLLALCVISGCTGTHVAHSTEEFPRNTGFIENQVVVDGQPHTVWVFVPKNYQPGKKYPAILFLHGLFEAGHGGDKVLSAGLGPVIAQDPDEWPFITIFPQSDGNWKGDDKDALAIASLDHVQRRWSVDQDRVILAGLSYGGLGTWEIGARHRDRFAALVPVSGHSAVDVVEELTTMPVWAFCSKDDHWVKAENSELMCQEIDAHGGKAKLTEFPGSNHDAWTMAVDHSDVVRWMLVQHRGQTIAQRPVAATPANLSQTQARALAFPPIDAAN